MFSNRSFARAAIRCVSCAAICLCIGAIFAFVYHLRPAQLFIGFDGGFVLDTALRQLRMASSPLALHGDFFSGMGDIYYPTSFKMFPSFWTLLAISDVDWAKSICVACLMAELALAQYWFSRVIGLSRPSSMAAAFLLCFCLFPIYRIGLVFTLVPVVPHIATSITVSLLMAGVFARFGRMGLSSDWFWAVAFCLLICWTACASIVGVLIFGPFLAVFMIACCISATGTERSLKFVLLFIGATLFFACGPALLLLGVTLQSVPAMFSAQLEDNVGGLGAVSIFFHAADYGLFGPALIVGAAIGGMWSAWKERGLIRLCAAVMFLLAGVLAVSGYLIAATGVWRGPAPIYLEVYMIPLYSIFAVDCVRRVSNWLRSSLRAPNLPDWSIEIGLVLLAVGLAAYAKSRSPSSSYGFEYPPKPSPIVEVLKVQTGLVPGADFRGRAVTLTGRNIDRPIGWLDLHGQDAARANEIGNEHRVSGLSYFDIPHLFPYGASLPLAYHVLVSRLLARPGDREMRNVEVLREFNPTILRMLGARYVIADGEIGESAELRATATAGRDGNLYLYELPEPNLGQFSPTSATRVDNATELMRRLRDPAFDPMSEILVQQPRAGAFVPARDTSLVYEGVTLRYRAKSDAQSLALLPVDFSHCLTIDSPSGGAVQIFRANLALTGLQFSGAIDIRITTHTGPFDHPACLLADRNELAALRLADVPLP